MEKLYTPLIISEIQEEIEKITRMLKVSQQDINPEVGRPLNREERRRESKRMKKEKRKK